MEPALLGTTQRSRIYDVAIVGAGPVGLAIAIELAKLDLATIVVDRRPSPADDGALRPQLLVARAGDLAHLAYLGVDVEDREVVAYLAERREADLASGRVESGDVRVEPLVRPVDVRALAAQPPLALVPIGRLQQALLALAVRHGADVRYTCDVVRLRRHARAVSLQCADGASLRASLAIVATGASRSLIAPARRGPAPAAARLVAGVFAVGGDRGRWVRAEVPVPGLLRPVRCTMLQTPADTGSGTALLVDPQLGPDATDAQLRHAFDAAARALGLAGAPALVPPQAFATGVTSVARRVVAGDGRAPVVVAGDAAQTGHVFSGQTCFVNVALALSLCEALGRARTALVDGAVTASGLAAALARYAAVSEQGATVLAASSRRHLANHPAGAWALAGVARA